MASHIAYGICALLACMCMAGAAAHAAVIVYPDSPSWSAAAGPQLFLIDFNGSPGALVSGNTISPDVLFGSPEAPDPTLVNWNSDALSDAGSTVAANAVGPMSLDFSSSVFGFSLLFSSAAEAQTVELYGPGMALIDSVLAPNASGFFGVVSDTAISSVIIRPGLFPGGNPDRFFIDDLRGAGAVPETSTYLMTVGGLIAVFLGRRAGRRRRFRSCI
jgi:hypothetical protein